MSIEITEKCDRCGDSWERGAKDKQIWTVGIGISYGTNVPIKVDIPNKADWCRKCVVETGLLNSTYVQSEDNRIVKLDVRPTFEERVVELIRELGFKLEQ